MSFNDYFKAICINDYYSQEDNFSDIKKYLKKHERLQVNLPHFSKEIKKTVQPIEALKEHLKQDPIKPIPWKPSMKKKINEQTPNNKFTNDLEESSRKRKYNDEEIYTKKIKLDENEERSDFISARHMFNQDNKKKISSPAKIKSGLKKPFNCPVRSNQPQQEEKKISGIEDKLIEMIESEIITRNPCVKWSDIAGLDFAKKTVHEAIVWPLKRPDLFRGLRAPPKGLLLFGPPGTGKTMIGKAIASEVSATFFSISASSITSKWVGEGEKLVRVLFALAIKNQPSVIFIDEIDSLLSCRSDSEQEGSRRIKTEFLVQMDGAATNPDDRILLIGATNRPQELDEAMRRRLAKRMYIPLPNSSGRKQILQNLMQSVPNSITDLELDTIVEKSKGFSGSDMKNLCTEASMFPLRSILDISSLEVDQIPPVRLDHFLSAFESTRSSVSTQDISQLLQWNQSFGSFQFDYTELDT
jgi:fidgetin-like protein 1